MSKELLAAKIDRALKEQNIKRKDFAVMMGVQPSIITRWLSGTHNFTIETLFSIEEKLNIKLVAVDMPKVLSFHMSISKKDKMIFTNFVA